MDYGVVEHQHRGAGAGGGPRIQRVDDEGRVQAAPAGGGVQLVGGRVVEAQHVAARAVPWLRGHLFAGKLPAAGDGRGQAKAGFAAVIYVHVTFFFQFLHPAQAFGFVGVVLRVLRLFQGVAEAPPSPATLFKKCRKVQAEKSLANSWRNVVATSLSCCRLAHTAAATGAASAAPRMSRRPCPAALARPASPPRFASG